VRNERQKEEYLTHCAIVEWAQRFTGKYPPLAWLFHIPNGERRDAQTGAKLKRMGTKAGVLDFTLQVARHGFHGLWIEVKAKNGTFSESQRKFIAHLKREGYCVMCARNVDDGIGILTWYLDLVEGEERAC
jgi:hypothetical protein